MASWYHHDYPQSIPQDFSTLEVIPQPLRPDESFKELPALPGLEALQPDAVNLGAQCSHLDALEVAPSSQPSPASNSAWSPHPASSFAGSSHGLTNEKELMNNSYRPRRTNSGLAFKTFWFSLVLAVPILAVVVGLSVGLTVGLKKAHFNHGTAPDSTWPQASSTATGVSNSSSLAI